MGSTVSFVVAGSYAVVMHKYQSNKISISTSLLDVMWETTFVMRGHWTVPRLIKTRRPLLFVV